MPGRLQGGQFVEHVIMAVPARLETVVDKLGVMTSEHVVSPGPEQAQGRCALLPCGQVWPPDGPLAPGPGRLPLSQLTCQRGEVIEAVFEFDDSAPLSLDVPAEGAQLPVKPLILVELALLVLAEVSQEPGQLAYLSFEPYEVAGTAAGGFMSFGRPPPDLGDLLGSGRDLPPAGRPVSFAHGLVLTCRCNLWLRHGLVLITCCFLFAVRAPGRPGR